MWGVGGAAHPHTSITTFFLHTIYLGYNKDMQENLDMVEFRPELLSRRGEATAWGLALLVFGAWFALRYTGYHVPGSLVFLAFFLLFAALGISLGNWMDRRTKILLKPEGIAFSNGLRNVFFPWEEIRQVQIHPSRWGNKVRVIGEKAYFDFRTLGEVTVQGTVKGRMGFVVGEKILRRILEAGRLEHRTRSSVGTSYYYSRE